MLRQINATEEKALFDEAAQWGANRPEWFKVAEAVDTPNAQAWYEFACQPSTLNFGVWMDGEFCALIQFSEAAPGCFEIHFDGNGSLAHDALADAIFTVIWELFLAGAQTVFVWTVKQHRAIRKICNACQGFWDGARRLKGSYKGRPIEWLRLSLSRKRWEKLRNEGSKDNTDQHLRLHESSDDGSHGSRQEFQVSG